jgi:hypothetical protein
MLARHPWKDFVCRSPDFEPWENQRDEPAVVMWLGKFWVDSMDVHRYESPKWPINSMELIHLQMTPPEPINYVAAWHCDACSTLSPSDARIPQKFLRIGDTMARSLRSIRCDCRSSQRQSQAIRSNTLRDRWDWVVTWYVAGFPPSLACGFQGDGPPTTGQSSGSVTTRS